MLKIKGISPKLLAAISPPLTAVTTTIIVTGAVDRVALATIVSLVIGAVLGYRAPAGEPRIDVDA